MILLSPQSASIDDKKDIMTVVLPSTVLESAFGSSDHAFPLFYILVLSSMVSVFRLSMQPAQVDDAFPREVKRNNGKLSSMGRGDIRGRKHKDRRGMFGVTKLDD